MPSFEPESGNPGFAVPTTHDRYLVGNRRDVVLVFRAIAKSKIPVKARVAQLGVTMMTRLLSVKPEFEELVFDGSALAGVELLDGSGSLTGEVQMETIWYRFDAEHVELTGGAGKPLFRARMPTAISRMQRRDAIRYPVPGLNPPVCEIPGATGAADSWRMRATDISLSGIALQVAADESRAIVKGSTLAGCMLHLPDIGAIKTDLLIVYVSPVGNNDQRRLGCRFSNLLATALPHLQRYVMRLERARLESGEHRKADRRSEQD